MVARNFSCCDEIVKRRVDVVALGQDISDDEGDEDSNPGTSLSYTGFYSILTPCLVASTS